MEEYKNYVKTLKEHLPGTDYSLMLNRIEQRRSNAQSHRTLFELAAAGALAAIIIALLFYGYPRGEDYMADYVLKGDGMNGSPMVAYIFSDE